MLIGGASLYQQTIELASSLYVTRIHHCFEGDTWFPEVDTIAWQQVSREDHEADLDNPYAYSFLKFKREF